MKVSWFTLLSLAGATPSATFPFNNQLPPVAIYGQQYSYTYSADTYTSSEKIYYSAPDLPPWLKFDADSKTLSGTPPAEDASQGDQQVHFNLQASDSTGTLVSPCFLQLSNVPQPQVKSPDALTQVLSAAGNMSDAQSLVLKPGQPFEITFPSDFFTNNGQSVIGHYSVTGDHAPLPIWIDFDGEAGKFTGTAPSVTSDIAPAQSYSLLYIVSTYQGFSSASVEFDLKLGAHILIANITTEQLNVTVNKPFEYQIPLSHVQLDGVPIAHQDVADVVASLPENASWLNFTSANGGVLAGTPPADAANSTVTVQIDLFDKYNDTVSLDIAINVLDNVANKTVFSASTLSPANVTEGNYFTYSIANALLTKDNIEISVDTNNNDWLSYNSGNYSLQGMPPSSFNQTTIKFAAKVTGDNADHYSGLDATLPLMGVSKLSTISSALSSGASSTASSTATKTHSTATSTTTATATAAPTSTLVPVKKHSSSTGVAVGCGVGIPLGLIALALLLFLLWRRRKKQAAAAAAAPAEDLESGYGADGSPGSKEISNPVLAADSMMMAPVFKLNSGSSSDSNGTAVGADEKKADETDPQRRSTFNFMRMDGDDDDAHTLTNVQPMEALPVPRVAENNGRVTSVATSHYSDSGAGVGNGLATDVPRASWRHTNLGERRWQDARISYSSLASIDSADGPPTVQLANAEFAAPPPRPLPRDGSSGIMQRLGSHSSSLAAHAEADNESTPRVVGSMGTFAAFRGDETLQHDADDAYHTASSGSESEEGSVAIRPWRDSQGEMRWAAPSAVSANVERKPSKVGNKPPEGERGELAFI